MVEEMSAIFVSHDLISKGDMLVRAVAFHYFQSLRYSACMGLYASRWVYVPNHEIRNLALLALCCGYEPFAILFAL